MKTITESLTGTFALLLCASLILAAGCSSGDKVTVSQTRDAVKLLNADNLIVSSYKRHSELSLAGGDAQSLLKAVGEAELPRRDKVAGYAGELRFFSGTNLIGVAPICYDLVWCDGRGYFDRSGVLRKFQVKADHDEESFRRAAVAMAIRLQQSSELPAVRSWISTVSAAYKSGKLKTTTNAFGWGEIQVREVPQLLSTQLKPVPRTYIVSMTDEVDVIRVEWSHCGIILGRESYVADSRAWFQTNVSPGIYVYHDGL